MSCTRAESLSGPDCHVYDQLKHMNTANLPGATNLSLIIRELWSPSFVSTEHNS